MGIRVGINGFGRMGRLAFRAAWHWSEFDITHINELNGGPETAAHLLEFDTVHGRWNHAPTYTADSLTIEHKRTGFSDCASPAELDADLDIVIDCTGKFRTPELLQPYFDRGIKKVIVAAPVKEGALNLVMGVNDHLYSADDHHLLTAASCTTNCLAPAVKVLQEHIGIEHGSLTTIHDVTNTQVLVDAPHKDLRRARSALNSLIPTSTGSATAITYIFPELKGKLNGMAVRVPLLNASLTDCVFEMKRDTSVEEVNELMRAASQASLRGILGFESKPLVSADYVNDTRSGIVDGPATMVIDKTQLKMMLWYDNEVGYANRLMELVRKVALALD